MPARVQTFSAFCVTASRVPLPRDGGDRAQVGERAAGGEEDRERVVVTGVAVEDDRDAHALCRSCHARAACATSSAQSTSDIAVASTMRL